MAAAQQVNVGIIGGGLMGREIASAIARWPALLDHPVRPRLTAVCDLNPAALRWFDQLDTVRHRLADYRDLLAAPDVDVVYVAVRHDLHERLYLDTIRAGKDLLGEKPFGIDLAAAERIAAAARAHPDVFVRCSSEMPFYPGAQAALAAIRSGELGRPIEAACYLSHSSDLDLAKPINWKRQARFCGSAGVMNDLGMHACHAPLRLGWTPASVYAVLQDLVPTRPGPGGAAVACDTYENATLLCRVGEGDGFPVTLGMKRIDPGQQNSWGLRATGMAGGVEFTTRYPKTLRRLRADGAAQAWQDVEIGSQSPTTWPTITGAIFEFGFPDAILQMLAAYFAERAGALGDRFGCATVDEALASHRIFTAAEQSHRTGRAVPLDQPATQPGTGHD